MTITLAICVLTFTLSIVPVFADSHDGTRTLALESTNGLDLYNVIASSKDLNGMRGIRLSPDPKVVQEIAEKRQKIIQDCMLVGSNSLDPGYLNPFAKTFRYYPLDTSRWWC